MKQFLAFICLTIFIWGTANASVRLRPEQAMPESAYKSAYSCCVSLWYDLRKNQNEIAQDTFIDGLITLDNSIQSLAAHQGAYSPEDIEHLAGSLNRMHMDYANTAIDVFSQEQKNDPEAHDAIKAAHYFFKRIKRKLELLLPT